MKIAGFKKQSLIDYPGNISAVIFTQGCNFRCGFCHNPDLVLPEKFGATYDENQILAYLKKYSNLMDAVCITGGEPTIHNDLPDLIRKIKILNLKVKLDSNGTNPAMLQDLIENKLIDFVAMDIKHVLEFDAYNKAVGNCINKDTFFKVLQSVNFIEKSDIEYEFRTTVIKNLHQPDQIKTLKKRFGDHYKIQQFNPQVVLNLNSNFKSFSQSEYEELVS